MLSQAWKIQNTIKVREEKLRQKITISGPRNLTTLDSKKKQYSFFVFTVWAGPTAIRNSVVK